MMKIRNSSLPALLLLWLTIVTATNALGQDQPDISGTWLLNAAMSEDLDRKVEAEIEKVKSRTGGFRVGIGDNDPNRRRSGEFDRQTERQASIEEQLAPIRHGVDRIRIEPRSAGLLFVYSDGRERLLVTDGKKSRTEIDGYSVTTTSEWTRKDRLVVTTKYWRAWITETYWLEPDGNRLFVSIKIEGDGPVQRVTVQRTYDPVEE